MIGFASTLTAILAGLAVACQVLMFPPVAATWLAWLAPLPLFLLYPMPSFAAAVGTAWGIGTLVALAVDVPWMWPAMRDALGVSALPRAAMLAAESQLVGGIPYALLGALLQSGTRLRGAAFAVFAPAAWVAAEWVRAHTPFAAPWILLGSALPADGLAAQVADLGGVYAVSFVMALPSAALAVALRRPRQAYRAAALAAVLVAAAFVYGTVRLDAVRARIATAPTLRVALVRAEVSNEERLAPHRAAEIVTQFLAASPPADAAVDLVVWPENTVPVLLDENPELTGRIAARATNAAYLLGAPRIAAGTPRSLRACAFLVGANGIEGAYDKQRLLPGAETAGGGWRHALAFAAGGPAPLLAVRGVRFGTTICYEAVFPELARGAARDGAGLLVNLSNDSWFAAGAGPQLHFQLGLLRAVETRRAVVRVSNGGVTALILPDGRVVAREDGGPGSLVVAAPVLLDTTWYVRAGDCFAWACLACATGASWRTRRRPRRSL